MQSKYKAPMFEVTHDTSVRTGESGTAPAQPSQYIARIYNRKERRKMQALARQTTGDNHEQR